MDGLHRALVHLFFHWTSRSTWPLMAQAVENHVRSHVGYWGVKRTYCAQNEFCR
jgi:hypothetical protein